ncbi:MAG TPA: tetratricopeptide repeat protein [Gammaproteobacteria bacterium]|nr:tetratricopeptide repeat protein [Gammaproteobacteria bacterium]
MNHEPLHKPLHTDRPAHPDKAFVLCIAITFILLLGATILAYWPGLSGGFQLDDAVNLAQLRKYPESPLWQRILAIVLSGPVHPVGRPLSIFSFFLNDISWPSNARPFLYTNLMLHLLNGVLFFSSARLLSRLWMKRRSSELAALLATGLWLLHPYNVSTVLYAVQRMTELSALFILLSLFCYLYARTLLYTKPGLGYSTMTAAVVLGTALGILAKENAALIPLLLLITEFILVGPRLPAPATRLWKIWRLLFLILPSILLLSWLWLYVPLFQNSYGIRGFNLSERLLTEARVIFSYLYHLLLPHRVGTGLFHDDYLISRGLLQPPSTLLAIIGLSGITLWAWRYRRRWAWLSFGWFWFLAGHMLEAGPIALELYFEHRNYLPATGLLLGFAGTVFSLRPGLYRIARIGSVGLLLLWLFSLWQATSLWGQPVARDLVWASEHPDSQRARATVLRSYLRIGNKTLTLQAIDQAAADFPDSANNQLLRIHIRCLVNAPISKQLATTVLNNLARIKPDPALTPTLRLLYPLARQSRCQGLTGADVLQMAWTISNNPTMASYPDVAIDLHIFLSNQLFLQGRLDQALLQLQQAISLNPRYVELYLLRAQIQLARRNWPAVVQSVALARKMSVHRLFHLPIPNPNIDSWEQFIAHENKSNKT